jgi:hypothetical protein
VATAVYGYPRSIILIILESVHHASELDTEQQVEPLPSQPCLTEPRSKLGVTYYQYALNPKISFSLPTYH